MTPVGADRDPEDLGRQMRAAIDDGEPYDALVLGDDPALVSVEVMLDLLRHVVGEVVGKASDYGPAFFQVLGCHRSDGHQDMIAGVAHRRMEAVMVHA